MIQLMGLVRQVIRNQAEPLRAEAALEREGRKRGAGPRLLRFLARVGVEIGHDGPDQPQHRKKKHDLVKEGELWHR